MAIADTKLNSFFNRQKIGTFDALKQSGKVVAPNTKIAPREIDNKATHKDITLIMDQSIGSDANLAHDQMVIEKELPIIIASKPLANHNQTASKPFVNQKQSVSKTDANQQQLVSKSVANHNQNVSKTLAENDTTTTFVRAEQHTYLYAKKERELLLIIFQECVSSASLVTRSIGTDELLELLKTSPERLRNLIFRIQKKGGFIIKTAKAGRDACRVFELSQPLYQSIHNEDQRKQRIAIKPLAEPLATLTNSSSININTTTELSKEWREINTEVLQDIGFSSTQLKQVIGKNTPDIVQESIYHFAFGLQNNPKVKQYSDPLNVLMGVLRKGQGWIEQNYQSPQEIAQQQFIERKKAEKERLNKLEEDAFKLAFDEWLESIPDDLKKTILAKYKGSSEAMLSDSTQLYLHYKKNVWPEKKSEYLIIQ